MCARVQGSQRAEDLLAAAVGMSARLCVDRPRKGRPQQVCRLARLTTSSMKVKSRDSSDPSGPRNMRSGLP